MSQLSTVTTTTFWSEGPCGSPAWLRIGCGVTDRPNNLHDVWIFFKKKVARETISQFRQKRVFFSLQDCDDVRNNHKTLKQLSQGGYFCHAEDCYAAINSVPFKKGLIYKAIKTLSQCLAVYRMYTHTHTRTRRGISLQDITAINNGAFSLSEKNSGGDTKRGRGLRERKPRACQ